jgi:mono/diheme cytochrome c family protein
MKRMIRIDQAGLRIAILVSAAVLAAAQESGKRDAGGFPAPTAELERGRTVYVMSSCHFCHGIDLTGAAMGAANLMYSALVGRDEKGNLIGPVVRAGLPNLQTAMPQYSDYSDQQIADLASYIHYLRQLGRYKELTGTKEAESGDAGQGRKYFTGAGNCGACHSPTKDLAGIGKKYRAAELRARFLRPGPAIASEADSAGVKAHRKLLERFSNGDVRNVLAYLATIE